MIKSLLFSFLIIVVIHLQSCKTTPENNQSKDWISLFDGESLEGWTPKLKGEPFGSDSLDTFRVEDGVLKVSYDNYNKFDNRFGHLFYKTPFSSYKLQLEYRFVGDQVSGGEAWAEKNSGIMIHSQHPETMDLHQDFPNSLEFQLLGGVTDSIARPTGSLCTPGTHVYMENKLITKHCITADAPTFHGEEWVKAEVEVYKDSLITHKINNKEVISYHYPVKDLPGQAEHLSPLQSGYISLQSESHPVEFKAIQIQVLD